MTEKLKPCPFCGRDAAGFSNSGYGFIVKCRKCGTKTDVQETAEEAAAFWNERKPLSEIVPSNSIEFLVKFAKALADISSENKRLREALEEIKNQVEQAQDTVYPFHLALDGKDGMYILELAKKALKRNEE